MTQKHPRLLALLGVGAGLTAGLAPASTAMAFAPTSLSGAHLAELDAEVGPPSRIHVDHPEAQRRLSAESLAWQRFSAEHPAWRIRWDEATGSPLRMLGDGIDLGDVSTPEAALLASRDLLAELEDLLGVSPADLTLVANEARGDQHFVVFQRTVAGIPVEGAFVQLRFKFGRLVMIGGESHPGAREVSTRPRLSRERALAEALAETGPGLIRQAGTLVILPVEGSEGLGWALAWRSVVEVDGPLPALWFTYVDASTGVVLHRYNDVRYTYRGTIVGGHEERTIGDPVVAAPLFDVEVAPARGKKTNTDRAGNFSLAGKGSAALETRLRGTLVQVRNKAGDDPVGGFTATDGVRATYDWGYGTTAPMSATNTYHHTHVVRDRALAITPDLPELQTRMISNIEITDACNAFFNGWSINFFQESADCNNTGRIADVVYHEYGHFYHSALVVNGWVDGAVGEGSGDYLSATLTNDAEMAPGFYKDGGGIRNLGPDMVYPNDLVGEVHADGLIWGGGMWDVRTRLITELGPVEGVRLSDHLFAYALMGGPTLATAYEEVLVADDDDGDLANGTPHLCLLSEELGRHGLGPGVRAVFEHKDTAQVAAGAPLPLEVYIYSTFEDCLRLNAASSVIRWSTSPTGPWNDVPLTAGADNRFTGAIPAQPAGTLLYYTFAVTDADGGVHSANNDREFALFQTWVGPLTALTCEGFEGSDGGYTHTLRAGDPSEGADDWMWGAPSGAAGDPLAAAEGSRVWGNDLAPEGFNGSYQANKVNALTSAVYSTVGEADVLLRYRRWLNVEDSLGDQATLYVNDTPVWQNETGPAGRANTLDDRWVWHYVPLDGLADDTDAVWITWELATNGSIELGGWNIDDVCLMVPR